VEIPINSQPWRVKTWPHDTREPRRHHEWPQFMIWSESWAGSYLTLVPFSMRMPWWTHHEWPDTVLYDIHKDVRYRPTQWHMKLLSLWDPRIPYALVHNSNLIHSDPTDAALIDSSGGYHPGTLNFRSLTLLPIQYSPLSPNCLARSPIMPTSRLSC
jgi:hypothetical protein